MLGQFQVYNSDPTSLHVRLCSQLQLSPYSTIAYIPCAVYFIPVTVLTFVLHILLVLIAFKLFSCLLNILKLVHVRPLLLAQTLLPPDLTLLSDSQLLQDCISFLFCFHSPCPATKIVLKSVGLLSAVLALAALFPYFPLAVSQKSVANGFAHCLVPMFILISTSFQPEKKPLLAAPAEFFPPYFYNSWFNPKGKEVKEDTQERQNWIQASVFSHCYLRLLSSFYLWHLYLSFRNRSQVLFKSNLVFLCSQKQ